MVGYTTAPRDLEMGPQERTVVLVEKKQSSTGWIWKACGALLLVALCCGGTLLLAWRGNGSEMTTQSGQTQALIEEDSAEKTATHLTLKQISSNAKAAIHLGGRYNEQDKVEWRIDQGQTFAQGGLQMVENKIVIPQTGLYFVYSQVSFSVSCGDPSVDPQQQKLLTTLSHRIWRFSESMGSAASMMSGVRSACQTTTQDGQGWYNTIYLGAVFKLNQGDKLWTETKPLSELETDEGQNFFGVFAL